MVGSNGMPRIGITPYIAPDGKEYLPQGYLDAIAAIGCEPFQVDLSAPLYIYWPLVASFDAFIFPGGGDIDPSHYGQAMSPACGKPNERRDQVELALMDLLMPRCVPILGICRGIQLINVALGGTLVQDIPTAYGTSHEAPVGEAPMTHEIRVAKAAKLSGILGGERATVNSYHHQCVDQLAESLIPAAWAQEGFVEAFEGPGPQFLLGVQWHPERDFLTNPGSMNIFKALRNAIH